MLRVLFMGTKSFWTTKSSVEITIIEHSDHDVLEIIAIDFKGRFEAERIFLDALALYAMLEAQDGSPQKELTDISSELGIVVKTKTVSDKAISTFICNHLYIKNYLPVSKILEMEVRSTHKQQDHNELMVPRPVDLPISTSPIEGHAHVDSSASPRSPEQDESRQPLIFTRVSQGLPLTEADVEIWTQFTANKTQQEIVALMTKALVDRVPENEQVLQSAAHAAIATPAQTPFPAPRFKPPSSATLPHDLVVSTASPPMVTATKRSGGQPSPGLPPLQPTGGGTRSRRDRLRDMLGYFSSNDPSPNSSAASSAVSSAASSPAGSRSASPAVPRPNRAARCISDPTADAANAAFTALAAHTDGRHSHSRSSPLLGTWKDSLQRGLGLRGARSYDDFKVINPTSRMAFGSEEEEDGHIGSALAGLDIDDDQNPGGGRPVRSPSPSRIAGSSWVSELAGQPSVGSAPLAPRTPRRRTFDVASGLPACASQPKSQQPSSGGAVTVKKPHRRTGSGGLLGGIAGPSNRVQPISWGADGADLGQT